MVNQVETVVEVVSIHQKVRKLPKKYQALDLSIKSPDDAALVGQLAINLIGDSDREIVLVVGVSTKNRVNVIDRVHIGSLNASIVSPREMMKSLILHNCSGFFFIHNHPSNNVAFSPEDLSVTERLSEVGEILGIELLDSLIVSDTKYFSFREKGYI